jgi:glycolate oxidase iron-sulfur subunit
VGKVASFLQRALLAVSPKGSALRLLLPAVRIDRERRLPVFAARTFVEQVPGRIVPREGRLPRTEASSPAAASSGASTAPRGTEACGLKVAYFVGCSANLIYTNIAFSVVDVLSRLGVEVIVPRKQGCCGLPVINAGDFVTARGMARRNVEMLRNLIDREKLDAVVVSCSSCGLAFKREYSSVLGVDATGVSEKVMDVSELIVKKVGLDRLKTLLAAAARGKTGDGERTPSGDVVTYHDPCHLRRGQGIKDEPRLIIGALPGVRFVEMRDADRCCGGAGLYSFTQYEMSRAIAAHKVRAIVETGAGAVLTGCASCVMQIEDALRQAGSSQRVLHLIEFVSERLGVESRLPQERECSEKH